MIKFLTSLALVFVLAGCATTANYEKMLDSWVGATELDLIRQWGAPVQAYESSGRKFLVYSSRRNVFVPGVEPTYRTTLIGNTAYTTSSGGTPAQIVDRSCLTTFELLDDEIVSWSWRGNDCTKFDWPK